MYDRLHALPTHPLKYRVPVLTGWAALKKWWTNKPVDEPLGVPGDEPVEEPLGVPVDELVDKPVDKPVEPVDELFMNQFYWWWTRNGGQMMADIRMANTSRVDSKGSIDPRECPTEIFGKFSSRGEHLSFIP